MTKSIKLFQTSTRGQAFLDLPSDITSVLLDEYRAVWQGSPPSLGLAEYTDSALLELLFVIFNKDNRPGAQEFRSMSVSDLIRLESDNGDVRWYFCSNIGFKEVSVVGCGCPHCGQPVSPSALPEYAWQCKDCDEDFYSFECPRLHSQKKD